MAKLPGDDGSDRRDDRVQIAAVEVGAAERVQLEKPVAVFGFAYIAGTPNERL